MPEDPEMIHRIGREVREHGVLIDRFDERLTEIERACDELDEEELRRRIERVESTVNEHQSLMRESNLMFGRLNEILSELKEQNAAQLRGFTEVVKDVTRLNTDVAGIKWLGGSIILTGFTGIAAYLFQVPT
jgi:predicted RNase H-like nuclease (RuvC/YqgF family)